MQALMLAAGMGRRLGKYTDGNTKCMVEVAGKKLIDRAIEAVKEANINKMILVVGYKGQNLIDYIKTAHANCGVEFVFINNVDYAKSNNIYSFYLAKDYIINDDTILMESDLIYENRLIKELVDLKEPNAVAIAKYKSWMDGTVVSCNADGFITNFMDKTEMDLFNADKYYKTVNVYKFSKEFCKNIYIPFLESYMKGFGLNSYYETVLKVVPCFTSNVLYGYEIGDLKWYEIDDAQDLDISNVMFSNGKRKYDLMISKFGGYWRYERVLDFCYLVNPYFPTENMIKKLQVEFPRLLGAYPSGLAIQNMNAERMFDIDENYVLVGNGAAELINALGHITSGKIAVGLPTFNEYVRCFNNSEIVVVDNSKCDYQHNVNEYIKICKDVSLLSIISPDNPSGAMLTQSEVVAILEEAKKYNTKVLIDESFVDFADKENKYTLLNNELMEKYPNLLVVKSIGKSYGVAGLRLGILASADRALLKQIKDAMQIWNINSMAEYFMQIFNIYKKSYDMSCQKIADNRNLMINQLSELSQIRVYPSNTNFIMIDLKNISSYDLCVNALNNANILIKDLSTKNYFNGKNYIRVAVKSTEENDRFINFMKSYVKGL